MIPSAEMLDSPLTFSIKANNDESVRLSLTRKSDGTTPDLTGATVTWSMFKDGLPVLTKQTGDGGIVVLDQAEFRGKLQLNIEAADTVGLETDDFYIHEFCITDTMGNVNNPTTGDLKLTPGVVYLKRQYAVQA